MKYKLSEDDRNYFHLTRSNPLNLKGRNEKWGRKEIRDGLDWEDVHG